MYNTIYYSTIFSLLSFYIYTSLSLFSPSLCISIYTIYSVCIYIVMIYVMCIIYSVCIYYVIFYESVISVKTFTSILIWTINIGGRR